MAAKYSTPIKVGEYWMRRASGSTGEVEFSGEFASSGCSERADFSPAPSKPSLFLPFSRVPREIARKDQHPRWSSDNEAQNPLLRPNDV
jgi:hypothetical protein